MNTDNTKTFVAPEKVLAELFGKTSVELGMSEKRRDEVIAAAIFASFRNQEFGTKFKLPIDFRIPRRHEDAVGIDVVIASENGRRKQLQIKGVHIKRSIMRRRHHVTKGAPAYLGRRSLKLAKRDSEEITKVMKEQMAKIKQDYTGIFLIFDIKADFASQTSIEIAIRNSREFLEKLMAKEVWFLRNIPIRAIHGRQTLMNAYSYKLTKMVPDRHTYSYTFAI